MFFQKNERGSNFFCGGANRGLREVAADKTGRPRKDRRQRPSRCPRRADGLTTRGGLFYCLNRRKKKSNPSVSGTSLKILLDICGHFRYSTLGARSRADEPAEPAASDLRRPRV